MTAASTDRIAVTGSTGAVGGVVAELLADAGAPQLLLARTPARAPQLPGCVVAPFSYADRTASTAALRGIRTLFMVSAAESESRLDEHKAFIDAAAEAGVEHVVYTSFFGASPDSTFTLARDHFATEEHLKASGMTWTFLRDNFYMDVMTMFVGDDGVLRGPAGDGRVSVVSRADVAAVASSVLLAPDAHRGATYDLTGPEALTATEIAAAISHARGTAVTFHDESLEEAYESRAKWGAPAWQNDAWVSTYTAIASGELSRVTGDVERVTGRPPLTFAAYLAEE
ncbi:MULTISPECIES: SDR family oxidoreductase [unclassified Pseudoclavibacter]|uniref:SDR family oxidoreductase n=1 Tax=unclassified Pseudoclavibacter TaxID=2615177 RepID=UPI001BA66FA6|nr:SDR family oxidoreductase [Pseudoclavibacter sp. Marseille-Q4354]MBS3179446.1 SDR family oxidoreductase [Pseudoclavibacter sp. Marseille-Q4354]